MGTVWLYVKYTLIKKKPKYQILLVSLINPNLNQDKLRFILLYKKTPLNIRAFAITPTRGTCGTSSPEASGEPGHF